MGKLSKYWIRVELNRSGSIREREVEVLDAKHFFHQQFPKWVDEDKVPDREIQRQLMNWFHSTGEHQKPAELCLRCFISNEIKIICRKLAKQFGQANQSSSSAESEDYETSYFLATFIEPFEAIELMNVVLDVHQKGASDRLPDNDVYLPVTDKVLQTFDPEKGGLSGWVNKLFIQNKAVKRFLLEHGILMETNWQILGNLKVGRLQRILGAQEGSRRAIAVLQAFQQVYFKSLQGSKRSRTEAYPPPSEEQLCLMAQQLPPLSLTPQAVLRELQELAQLVRQDRLNHRRGNDPKVEQSKAEMGENQLMDQYCQDLLPNFIQQVIEQRIQVLQRKRGGARKAEQFLQGLELFYCESFPMKDIALHIDLADQPTVSRLLRLSELKADISRNLIEHLCQHLRHLARLRRNPNDLRDAEKKIRDYLEEYVSDLMQASEQEGYNSKSRQMKSLYSQQICMCARARRKS